MEGCRRKKKRTVNHVDELDGIPRMRQIAQNDVFTYFLKPTSTFAGTLIFYGIFAGFTPSLRGVCW